mmetsp:Transcript_61531/g.109693  ORF Transcript_61531/g.109693 Transcript_61531/m.109693 type:complete len:306 (-) Transcript_61531:477-1394(-)
MVGFSSVSGNFTGAGATLLGVLCTELLCLIAWAFRRLVSSKRRALVWAESSSSSNSSPPGKAAPCAESCNFCRCFLGRSPGRACRACWAFTSAARSASATSSTRRRPEVVRRLRGRSSRNSARRASNSAACSALSTTGLGGLVRAGLSDVFDFTFDFCVLALGRRVSFGSLSLLLSSVSVFDSDPVLSGSATAAVGLFTLFGGGLVMVLARNALGRAALDALGASGCQMSSSLLPLSAPPGLAVESDPEPLSALEGAVLSFSDSLGCVWCRARFGGGSVALVPEMSACTVLNIPGGCSNTSEVAS